MEEHLEQLEYSESSFIEENFDKLILDDDDYFCPDEEFSFEEYNHHPKCDDNPYLKAIVYLLLKILDKICIECAPGKIISFL